VAQTRRRHGASHSRLAALLLAGLTLLPVRAAAQQGATIFGAVTDDSGGAIVGVTITVTHEATGLSRATETAADGTYMMTSLPAGGPYTVRAERRGFLAALRERVSVSADESTRIDFTLKLSAAETIAVSGTATTFVVDHSTVQQTVGERLTHALPLPGRQFMEVTAVAAGFTGNRDFPNAQGQLYWTNNVLIDGASSFSKWRGTARGFYSGYALESIEQVRVLTNTFSAEIGDALASVTTAITRSGTDAWHGSVLLFARGSALDARPAFALVTPPAREQQFGGSLGGPIVVGRTHVFASYEGHRSRNRNIVSSPAAPSAESADNQDEHIGFGRLDHQLSNRHILTARYNGQFFRWHYEPGGLTLPGSGTQFTNTAHSVLVTDRLQLSPRLLNDLRVQIARFVDMRRDLSPSVYISRAGYSIEGGSLGPFGFGTNPERTLEIGDTAAYWIGSHALQFGGSTKMVAAHDVELPFGRGAYFFAGSPALFPRPFLYMQSLAVDPASAFVDPRSLTVSAFLQDEWHVRPDIWVNAGARYDVDRLSNIRNYAVAVDTNNVQPRLGVTWAPGNNAATIFRGGIGVYSQQQLLSALERVQTGGADGAVAISLPPDSPLFPAFPAVLSPRPGGVTVWPARDVYLVDQTLRNPYSIQTSIGVQRRLFRSVVGVDYVTLTGRDLLSLVDVNAPAPIQKPAQRSIADADATRPIEPAPGTYRKMITFGNRGRSWYRALQAKVDRTSPSLNLIASYTWAHARDMANDQLPEDSRNLDAERARASTDIAHNVAAAFVWQPAPSRRLWRDWSVSGVAIIRTNRPYTVSWGDDRNGTTQNDARPDGRNTGKTGTYRTVDLAVGRIVHRGSTSIEARIEAFNAFNAINYDQYVGELLSPTFARPVSAFPPRRLQLAVVARF
jgi:hypothetical protein